MGQEPTPPARSRRSLATDSACDAFLATPQGYAGDAPGDASAPVASPPLAQGHAVEP